jgi:acyl-CoA synthetase (AMP-forming)/AMP-acid ligase II
MYVHVPDIGYRAAIPAALHRAVRQFGDREFIVTPTERMTYTQAERASHRVASELLAAGISKGTHVGLIDTFGTNWVIALLGITRIGAIAMPFPSTYRPAELRRGLGHGDVHAIIIPETILGRDMIEFVEAAVPELSEATEPTLFLEELPFLRHIYMPVPKRRHWATAFPLGLNTDSYPGDPRVSDRLVSSAESVVSPSDTMVIVFTSGATSGPKGVMHTHGAQIRHGWNLAHNFGAGISPAERVFCALPFFWVGGLTYQLMGAMAVGSAVLCTERFTPESALDLMERERATRFVGWGSQISAVRQHPTLAQRDLSSIPMFAPRVGRAADPELRHTSLGMTETGGPHTACPPDEANRILPEEMRGSFGRSLPYIEHRIVDPETGTVLAAGEVGEICVRGYNLMSGIYKRERAEVFDVDGWFHTGDRGEFRDGYLYYFGRLGEMIKSAGSNVSPREVEVALEGLQDVQLAIVVGLPDDTRDEIVAAAVVPKPGAQIDPDDLIAQVANQISSYKVPRLLKILDLNQVPWLPTGKPDKQTLAAILSAK